MIEHIEKILDELEPNWKTNPDMVETPKRFEKMLKHFFRGYTKEELDEQIKVFPTNNDQMVIVKDIECFGMCPHHLLPIIYKVNIGYIPNGFALGLSKLGRIAILLSAKPELQENFTTNIAKELDERLKPLGVMVVVDGIHGCMRCRGVEMNSSTITSDCRGAFRVNNSAREEFLNLIK